MGLKGIKKNVGCELSGNQMRNLAQAASGYKKVVEENRRLYNEVQDLKGNIRVYCRSRPSGGKAGCVDCIDEGTMEVITGVKNGKEIRKPFTFNRVFGPGATQGLTLSSPPKSASISFYIFSLSFFMFMFLHFDVVALVYKDTQPLIRSVLDGYNVCIFAYGQTGSGKTWTMVRSKKFIKLFCILIYEINVLSLKLVSWCLHLQTGPDVFTEETMGVNYRALNDLFGIREERKGMISYTVSVQMLEIYNEMIRDLLLTDGVSKKYPFPYHGYIKS